MSWSQQVYLSIFHCVSYALKASGHLLHLDCCEIMLCNTHTAVMLCVTATKLLAAASVSVFGWHSQSMSHVPSKTTNLDLWKLQPHLLPAAFREPGIMRVAYHCHLFTCAPTCPNICLRINKPLIKQSLHHNKLTPCDIFLWVHTDIQKSSCHT